MANDGAKPELLVIPCSGIGKVQGLVAREAAYQAVDRLLPQRADTVCLALLVTGDDEPRRKVQATPCVTLDGCPKLCARKNVELSGGKVVRGILVHEAMKKHRGADFGSPTALRAAGWAVVEELAGEVAAAARQQAADGGNRHG